MVMPKDVALMDYGQDGLVGTSLGPMLDD